MRTQYALAIPGRSTLPAVRRGRSIALGLVVMFMALAPILAVSGVMLAQILGFLPR